MRNKRSGTQDEKCIGRNISHMCLGLYSRCRFIHTNLYLKVLHFDILIQLKGTAHFLENVLGLIKGVCRINVPCLLIRTRENSLNIPERQFVNCPNGYEIVLQSLPIQMRATILYLANLWMDFKMLFTTNIFLYLVKFLLLTCPLISQFIAHF